MQVLHYPVSLIPVSLALFYTPAI